MADNYDPEAFDFAMPKGVGNPEEAAKFVRGASYGPFDLLGAPVDIANLLMGGAGGTKPVGGSEFLIDKYADLVEALGGSYDRPTHETSETVGRIIGGVTLDPGIAAGIGKLFTKTSTKTRGSGIEVKGSGNAELEASSSDLGASGPMVQEAGSDVFVPLEKKVGEARTSGLDGGINKALEPDPYKDMDYLPAANALIENPPGMNIGKKGLTGEQYLARLKNQPGVTNTELETSGLASFLRENKTRKIPLEEVHQYHLENSPKIEMVDGGFRHVSDQRMFGDDSITAQGRSIPGNDYLAGAFGTGGYEEIVFRDARFVGNSKTAPGAIHEGTHHTSLEGPIGHARQTSFKDEATGGYSTLLEENQSDLWSIYKSAAAREQTGGRDFVPLTPEKIKTFTDMSERLEDSAKYRTLGDALDDVDANKAMLRTIEQDHEKVTSQVDTIGKRNSLQENVKKTYVEAPDRAFAIRLKDYKNSISDSSVAPADRMGKEIAVEADLSTVIKQAVIEDNVALGKLSNEQLSNVFKLAADRSLKLAEGSDVRVRPVIRAPLNDAELKQALNIPTAKTVADEDALIAAGRLVDNIQHEFKNVFEKDSVAQTLAGIAPGITQTKPYVDAITEAKKLLPKAADNINPSLLRKDASELRRLGDEVDSFDTRLEAQRQKFMASQDKVRDIYGDAIESIAPDRRTAFEYLHYRNDQGKLAVNNRGFNTLATRFSRDPINFSDGSVGFKDATPSFTNPLPFETQSQVARYQLHRLIRKAADEGKTRFYLPDYRDLALKRGVDLNDPEGLKPYLSRYKNPQEKVIKELKKAYPDLEVGTVDTVQPSLNFEPRVSEASKQQALKNEQPTNEYPITYIDLTPLAANPTRVRRYAQGGGVDLRSGIGNVFKLYS